MVNKKFGGLKYAPLKHRSAVVPSTVSEDKVVEVYPTACLSMSLSVQIEERADILGDFS